ncbi:hypothetical protein GIB67_002075 [Kingdonia uniflora]|uniref:DNA-directed RNA polymerase n=1 Tax=Kingdonia uniflora TaxID=39325 RepID=A0A7J7KWN9_9MAGN|nr:hypothetical protein GIB67_002075 [Kingdonia uniflora]
MREVLEAKLVEKEKQLKDNKVHFQAQYVEEFDTTMTLKNFIDGLGYNPKTFEHFPSTEAPTVEDVAMVMGMGVDPVGGGAGDVIDDPAVKGDCSRNVEGGSTMEVVADALGMGPAVEVSGGIVVEDQVEGEKLVQEAVDTLLDNGIRGQPMRDGHNKVYKSFSDIIEGKERRFRETMLGKRVDFLGRSVIVVGPSLSLHRCGLPREIAIELFQTFVIHGLIRQHVASNIGVAKICKGFNANFDGDQMDVHVPLSLEAQAEARLLMFSHMNLLSPAIGDPICVPTQDMLMGLYVVTMGNRQEFVLYDSTNFIIPEFLHESRSRKGSLRITDSNLLSNPTHQNMEELEEMHLSARKGVVDTVVRSSNVGYLTRRLVEVVQHIVVHRTDCGTIRGISMTPQNGMITERIFIQTLIGRALADDIYMGSRYIAIRNQDIGIGLVNKFITFRAQPISIRTPFTCTSTSWICQLCYGQSLTHDDLVELGEAMGIIAGQSIGEPETQLTLRTFHTGGVFAGGTAEHARAPSNGKIKFNEDLEVHILPGFSSILVRNNSTIRVDTQITLNTKSRVGALKKYFVLARPVVTYEIVDGINLTTLFPQDLLRERDNLQLQVINYILYGNSKPIRSISSNLFNIELGPR